jgi:hypothetical protein
LVGLATHDDDTHSLRRVFFHISSNTLIQLKTVRYDVGIRGEAISIISHQFEKDNLRIHPDVMTIPQIRPKDLVIE